MSFASATATIVMPSCAFPNTSIPGVRIRDPRDRLAQLYCSLISWSREPDICRIVVGDNSNPKSDFRHVKSYANHYGTELEVLPFVGDAERVQAHGKGYGEGEIMNFIIANSVLLRGEKHFFKVTGRLFVNNFPQVRRTCRYRSRVFRCEMRFNRRLKRLLCLHFYPRLVPPGGMVRTEFYKCSIRFFANSLADRNQLVDDIAGYYLEHAYFEPLVRRGFSTFVVEPVLVGRSSSGGHVYDGGDFPEEVRETARALVIRDFPEFET
jgi:hypothetical protein